MAEPPVRNLGRLVAAVPQTVGKPGRIARIDDARPLRRSANSAGGLRPSANEIGCVAGRLVPPKISASVGPQRQEIVGSRYAD